MQDQPVLTASLELLIGASRVSSLAKETGPLLEHLSGALFTLTSLSMSSQPFSKSVHGTVCSCVVGPVVIRNNEMRRAHNGLMEVALLTKPSCLS